MRLSTFLCFGGLCVASLTSRAQTSAPTWQWAKALTSTSSAYLNNAVTDAAGNSYLLGDFTAPLTLAPSTTLTSTGQADGFLASFTRQGTLRWVQQFQSPNNENVRGLAVDRSGNAYVAGSYSTSLQVGPLTATATAGTGNHAFVVKFDSQGQPQWLRENGGVGSASGYDVRVDSQDNLYLTGWMQGSISFGNETLTNGDGTRTSVERDIYLVKYTPQGTVAWARQGGRTRNTRTYFHRVSVSPTDEVYLTCALDDTAGSFGSLTMPTGRGSYDGIVVKYSAQGIAEWVQRVGGPGIDLTLGSVAFDAAGRLGVGVRYEGTATLGSQTLTGSGIRTGALAVLDATTGAPVWTRSIMGSNITDCGDVVTDSNGNFYLSGFFDGTASIGSTVLTSSGGTDALVARFTPQGTLSWAQTSTGTSSESSYFMGIDNTGELVLSGSFSGTAIFGAQQLTTQIATTGANIFAARLGSTISNTRLAHTLTLTPYPNPANAAMPLHLTQLPVNSMIRLLDAQGRLIRQTTVATTAAPAVSLADCAAGTYYVHVVTPQAQQSVSRFVITP